MTFTQGYNSDEAEALISLLAQPEGTTPPPFQAPPLPQNWTLVFDSPQIGIFDNKWQLWQFSSGQVTQYAVLIRGTVYEAGSIIDDLLAVMIPASGSITVDSIALSYQLAANPQAGVHLGFALALLILLYDPTDGILIKLGENVSIGSDVFVAGHSQGAAIATLCRSYLNYSDFQKIFNYNYKTYVFSQPKPRNDYYGYDYESVTGDMGFTLTNTQDWVPQVPFTFELPGDVNKPNPLSVLSSQQAALASATSDIATLRENLATAQLQKYEAQLGLLGQKLKGQDLKETSISQIGSNITILPTLNFTGCGVPIILQGVPGTNPCDATDFFWQHHGAMYYDLIAGIPIPTKCS